MTLDDELPRTFRLGDPINQHHLAYLDRRALENERLLKQSIADAMKLAHLRAAVVDLAKALRSAVDVMGPLAKQPNVNPWLIESEQALADWENVT